MAPSRPEASPRTDFTTPLISRRDLIRRTLMAGASSVLWPGLSFGQAQTAETTPAQRGEDASRQLADPTWKPIFLSEQQNETLVVLSDLIIPATDTPGAKEALVNRYLDLLLSVQPAELQQKFLSSLSFLDGESQRQFEKEFRLLTPEDQTDLLRPLAYPLQPSFWIAQDTPDPDREHFARLKSLIAEAYYSSEIGQRELGWDGTFTHGPFLGCQHSETTHQ